MSREKSDAIRRQPAVVTRADVFASAMLTVRTAGEGFVDITDEVKAFVTEVASKTGMVTLFMRHTSASLTIQENADPDVLRDLTTALRRVAPESGGWIHDAEGQDDMPAHIRTMLTATSLQVPVLDGRLMLGVWQAIYVIEHRAAPHHREIVMSFAGARI
jgi:secondary thiamine-phosphate synthase enzyme